ncbi:MAG: alginate lyase family protein [Thiobacillaceae bacterium]
MNSLLWKLNRLRGMSLAEIVYRIGQATRAELEQRGLGLARPKPPIGLCGKQWVSIDAEVPDIEPYRIAAYRTLAGLYDVFALKGIKLGFPTRWNRDPKTGIEAPLTFGKTLNYRDESIVGNVKYLWEPNRHLELVTLAQASRLTGESKYAEGCRNLLESWFDQCPYPIGPNWTSSLEHGVRLMNWSVAWQLLDGENSALFADNGGKAFRQHWLDSIYRHCHFISGHLSKHSSANNHLYGEYMGLFMGALMWPCWRESSHWLELSKNGLEEEALKQNALDGVNREQAIWYHHEVTDMMLLCGLAGRANGVAFSVEFWQRLEAMLGFVASIMDVGGNVPSIGDADDAVMVRLSREPGFNVYRSLLATGAVLFNRPDFARKAGHFDDKSRWLLGKDACATFESLVALPPRNEREETQQAFPDGGYYILGEQFDTSDEVRIVADAGPLGYLSIAAHGHADALSFTLSVRGHEILIDPGTYAYHTQKKWRDYFRGTSAHNTVRVDGLDQSVISGNFMWQSHAKAWCEKFKSNSSNDVWIAAHNGYTRLKDPVTHRRSIDFDKQAFQFRVVDTLTCKESHHVEIFWHFSEACHVQTTNNEISAFRDNVHVTLGMPNCDWTPNLKSGQEDPPMGWVSRHFDQKCHSFSVIWAGPISGTTALTTEIRLKRHES